MSRKNRKGMGCKVASKGQHLCPPPKEKKKKRRKWRRNLFLKKDKTFPKSEERHESA